MRTRHASDRVPDFPAPFCAGRRNMRPHHGAVEHLHHMCGLAGLCQELEKCLKHARAAEPPEPLPDAVPVAELRWQGSPRDAVHREVV